jgi:hypothetical protein
MIGVEMRETDLFYVQRWSEILEAWDDGRQFLNVLAAIHEARTTPKLKRIVRYRTSDNVMGLRDDVVTIWQGTRVPEWLGEVSAAR